MLNNDELMQVIIADTAAKVVASLDEEAKKAIIANAIVKVLDIRDFSWRLAGIVTDEAKEFAREYVKKPEVQKQIKEKVIEAVEQVMDGLTKSVAREVQGVLKSQYKDWLNDKE